MSHCFVYVYKTQKYLSNTAALLTWLVKMIRLRVCLNQTQLNHVIISYPNMYGSWFHVLRLYYYPLFLVCPLFVALSSKAGQKSWNANRVIGTKNILKETDWLANKYQNQFIHNLFQFFDYDRVLIQCWFKNLMTPLFWLTPWQFGPNSWKVVSKYE